MKQQIYEMALNLKSLGLKQCWIKYRWKLVAFVFGYYLVRDTLIYIVFPFVIFNLLQ